ncbi:MAG: hypothetical protein E7429_03695 [Ruminococcaceae bacterium]|nr:hypothetical protein [Oscillospiraceae bacterium]
MLFFTLCFVVCFALVWFAGALLYESGNLWLAVVLGVALVLTLLMCILVRLRSIEKKLDKPAENGEPPAQ